uniref:5'-3' DNA helicase ZGRF1 n=1 Tax=Ficedula albicollis TaxID=59894 RepID=A0A803WFJ5_FICAL
MKKAKTWQDGILRVRTGRNQGFQGPRQVEKKMPAMEEEEKPTVLPLSKECQGSFPSKFYISSPLFSTICKKDAEANPSAGCREERWRDNGREEMSVSSLLSAPFSDSCEETEKPNSHQFVVKPDSPLLTGHAGPGAVSHHIRSTAQIIALLKSKPAQGHGEQTSGVTGCLSRFQAAENADLCDRKSPVLPAFSGDPAKGLVLDTQHLPFRQGTVNDEKDWKAQRLPDSAEQPCGGAVTGQRQDKKVNNLSQDLQDHCNTNSYFLPESTVSRTSDSEFVPSSGDISLSASPTAFENNPFGYREHSGTDRENFSVKLESELHPRPHSEGVSPELSGDVTWTEAGIVKEESGLQDSDSSPDGELMEVSFNLMETFDFNDTDNEDVCEREGKDLPEGDSSQSPGCLQGEDVAQDAALRPHLKPHSCCEVETHSQNEVKCSNFDGERGSPPQLCDSDARRAPVAFQGHQVKGSAASEVMLRAPCSQLGWQQHPENMDFAAETFSSPLFSRSYDLYDFRQVKHFFCSVILTNHTREESSSPEGCCLPALKATMKTRTPFVTLPATGGIPGMSDPAESEEDQQSLDSSGGILCSEPVAFPRSAPGPEDRNYETSVFGEYMEEGQRGSVPPVLPNVTARHRQSKWLKYQSRAQCDLIPENSADEEENDDICAQSILGMLPGDTGEGRAMNASVNPRAPSSAPLLPARSSPGECSRAANTSLPDLVSEGKGCFPVLGFLSLFFFPGIKQLNIMLFELAQRLHNALSKVDISFYTAVKGGQGQSQGSSAPLCNHMHPAKLVMVKKEGQNKGRLFYACDAPKAEQCSFFKWIEDVNPTQTKSRQSTVLHDTKSIGTYLRSQKIAVYEECQLLVRYPGMLCTSLKCCVNSGPKLYLKLSKKEHSSLYSRDDIWVVSKTLNFDPMDTFIASSAFFGPSSNNEIELLPLKGYSPSNWRSNMCVHALLVCNASGELASLRNMEEHFNPSTLPLIPYLLKIVGISEPGGANQIISQVLRVNRRKFTPPAMSLKCSVMSGPVSSEVAMGVAEEMIQRFSLNPDQAASLIHIAQMMTSCGNPKSGQEHQSFPITIIRGVFGAGKSYLLSVVILFLVQLFESSEATEGPRATPWKLLIASSTNVAVDRILLGLLDLGFEDFVRVGSIRKITKAILPHSLHAGSGNENEQLKELLALMKEDLTPAEKMYVRKSIEQHKLGTNKTILQQVKVVGVTCAACPFPCLNALRFPVVMLDECSQMTEPASLLPIARFQCEKLVLVGDPKQLPPTIQGSESIHEQGLEQTLFDRLCLMGHHPILLRTQYRCHPALSAIANELFYDGNLIDGISEEDRAPLLEWLPTLCFYSIHGMEQIERDNSFYNMAEARFTVKLIQSLIASGIEGAAIGVITLYKSQMYKIQNLLSGVHSEAFEVKPVQVSTVDAFQGAEREIIVLSCVRTRHFGFIDSEKRMNVALTRAKRHLLIVGSLPCLSRNRLWGRVIHHCKGWENGLQHASQCEQQLNDILKSYLENWEEEEQSKKKEK